MHVYRRPGDHLVGEQASEAARRDATTPAAGPHRAAAPEPGDRAYYQATARDQISRPEHWLPASREAAAAGLAWRRAREAATQQTAPATDQAVGPA